MSHYYNLNTGEYPRHIGDLYLLGYEDGQELPEGWVHVVETEAPVRGENQKVVESQPALIDGVWKQQWRLENMTAEEIENYNKLALKGVVSGSN